MFYRLNLLLPTDAATIQQGRFAAWVPNPTWMLLESRKWFKRAADNQLWQELGSAGDFNDRSDKTSFPGAPGIPTCVPGDHVSVFIGVPIPASPPATPPVVIVTAVFARNQLGQSNSASPFFSKLATVNGSPLKCTFRDTPMPITDSDLNVYWYVLNLTDDVVTLGLRIGRFEFNVGAIKADGAAHSEYAHDPEMDVGQTG